MSEDCIFCSIIAGEAPASTVYDSDRILGFMDINPVTRGHLLVIPKAHSADLADVDPTDVAEMLVAAQQLDVLVRESELAPLGVNLFYADGEAAGQEVFHAHLHVIPRYADDGFGLTVRYGAPPTRPELDGLAAVITRAR
jgi:diadenosine tetraphosphate (Ap4A) HIT family hydrolase